MFLLTIAIVSGSKWRLFMSLDADKQKDIDGSGSGIDSKYQLIRFS